MAKYQYRITGDFDWLSSSANAVFALANKLGSGKRITLRSLEITCHTNRAAATQLNYITLSRSTVSGGETVTPSKLDTSASALPSGIWLLKGAMVTSPTPIAQVRATKAMSPATALLWGGVSTPTTPGGNYRGCMQRGRTKSGSADLERLAIRPGEAVAVYASTLQCSVPLRFACTLVLRGSPKRTYTCAGFSPLLCPDQALFAIVNDSASDIIELVEWGVEEVGIFDSPYFQLVPIGGVEAAVLGDPLSSVAVLKMDTNYPDPSSWLQVVKDAPLNPFGVPQEYCSQGGLASPKGFNYLGAKDFVGPVWRAFFPEMTGAGAPGVKPDSLLINAGQRGADLLARRAAIVLREGEGLALASAAETAVLTTAVGVSGWSNFSFAAHIDVEPTVTPTLTVQAQVSLAGAEVRIYDMDDTPAGSLGTELQGVESCPTATYSYTGDIGNTIWLQIFKPGYREFGQAITLPAVQEYGYSITLQPDLNA